MTTGTHGRRLNAERLEYGVIADSAEIGCVSRGQLVGLAYQLPMIGLINGTEAHLLAVLLNTAPAAAFNQGGKPIVFKSNRQLGFEIGRSEGRVSRLFSRLYDCGLVVMRDSGNFKRYPVRDSSGKMITACGIDLRVFIARYHELQHSLMDRADPGIESSFRSAIEKGCRKQDVAARASWSFILHLSVALRSCLLYFIRDAV